MAPYEALYGRKCRTPLHWDEVGERAVLGPDIVTHAVELVAKILDKMQAAQSRQKSYVDLRRRNLEFAIGDHVFLKVSPLKGVLRFGKKGKLSPRYIGPFEVLEQIGTRAYRLALPPNLSGVHNVFHVSMLRRYLNSSHIIGHESMQWRPDLSYEEMPKQILKHQIRKLRNKEIKMVKVLWGNHPREEATWEVEKDMQDRYPELFAQSFRLLTRCQALTDLHPRGGVSAAAAELGADFHRVEQIGQGKMRTHSGSRGGFGEDKETQEQTHDAYITGEDVSLDTMEGLRTE
ncbi:uncharacterized protein LOC121972465 [Zingiber officinale]|uniref:uncharacterized protein LOC121972465 n=1 Tax=Zingiber officinale TaxID=94328 RepID=UPI001C4B76DE|nr:uncharacterized protein LOC121972465 [Zingiber officinale]